MVDSCDEFIDSDASAFSGTDGPVSEEVFPVSITGTLCSFCEVVRTDNSG